MADPLKMWLSTPFGAAVAQHIDNGLHVFPLHGVHPDDLTCTCDNDPCGKENKGAGKHPYSKTAPNGLLNATNNIEIAADMFEYRTDLNVGVATGKKSGIVVVDIDNKHNNNGDESLAKIQEALGFLPATLRLTTGNGYHLVFDYPEGGLKNSTNAFGPEYPGIDIRGDGGYIVIYPSRHFTGRMYANDPLAESKHLADLPAFYLDFLRYKNKEVDDSPPLQAAAPANSEWSLADIEDMLTHISADCTYDDWYKIGMALQNSGYDWTIFDGWSASAPHRYPEGGSKAIREKWRSFKPDRGITLGTLVDRAMLGGWRPKNERAEQMAPAAVEAAVAPLVEKIKKKSATAKTKPVLVKNDTETAITAPKESKIPSGPRFCFDPLQLPGILGETVRWITRYAIYDQPELTFLNVLAFAGAVFGRRYASPLDTRTNIYIVGIARTGSGKDHSRQMINRLALEAGLSNFIGGNSIRSDSGMLRGLVNNSSQILQLDEFGIFMQALSDPRAPHHIKAISRCLMSLYSDSKGVYHHGDYADAKNEPIKIACPNLCIYGTTTEASYIPALKRSALQSGELNRFIVVPSGVVPVPKESIPQKEMDTDLVAGWKWFAPKVGQSIGTIGNSAALVPHPITVEWGNCEGRQHQLNLEQVARANEETTTRDLWSRLMENTIKVAMIFAISRDSDNPEFCQEDFDYAYSVVRASIDYMASLVDDCIMETPQEQSHNEVLKAINESGEDGITRRNLLRAFRRLRKRDIDDLISTMVEEEAVAVGRIVPAHGRPQVMYYSAETKAAHALSHAPQVKK